MTKSVDNLDEIPNKNTYYYKAHDGTEHKTPEGLAAANERFLSQNLKLKSSILGKEYLNTPEGYAQMKADEDAYWEAQKIKPKSF